VCGILVKIEQAIIKLWHIFIYLLTAIGLSPDGSKHLHTNNTQNNTNNNRTTQITTNVEVCGQCPVFASFILAFVLQVREKHRKYSVRVKKTLSQVKKNLSQNTVYSNTEQWKCCTECNVYFIHMRICSTAKLQSNSHLAVGSKCFLFMSCRKSIQSLIHRA